MTRKDALSPDEIEQQLEALDPEWVLNTEHTPLISRTFSFADYDETIAFVNKVAAIANEQDHHPLMVVEYAHCTVEFSTHSADGVTLNDLICAARIDALVA
jgi:4a-hydroxytetrahydrobiopterin dehydratase